MTNHTHITEENADVFILTIFIQETRKIYAKLNIKPFMPRDKTAFKVRRVEEWRIDQVIDDYFKLMTLVETTFTRPTLRVDKWNLLINLLVNGISSSIDNIDDAIEPIDLADRLLTAGYTAEIK